MPSPLGLGQCNPSRSSTTLHTYQWLIDESIAFCGSSVRSIVMVWASICLRKLWFIMRKWTWWCGSFCGIAQFIDIKNRFREPMEDISWQWHSLVRLTIRLRSVVSSSHLSSTSLASSSCSGWGSRRLVNPTAKVSSSFWCWLQRR